MQCGEPEAKLAPDTVSRLDEIESFFRRNGLAQLCERTDPQRGRRLRQLLGAFNWVLIAACFGGVALSVAGLWPLPGWTLVVLGVTLACTFGIESSEEQSSGELRFGRIVTNGLLLNLLYGGVFPFALLLWEGVDPWVAAAIGVAVAVVNRLLQSTFAYLFATALPSLFWNGVRALRNGIAKSLGVAARGMPLVFLVLVALFFTADAWRFLGDGDAWRLVGLGGVLIALVGTFLVVTLRDEWKRLCALDVGEDHLDTLARATPAGPLVDEVGEPLRAIDRPAARLNIAISLTAAVTARVLAVGLLTGAVFLSLGVVRVDDPLANDMLHHKLHAVLTVGPLILSWELIRVSLGLALLAMVLFAVTALTDEAYRPIVVDDELRRLREVVAAWAYYSPVVAAADAAPPPDAPVGTAVPAGRS